MPGYRVNHHDSGRWVPRWDWRLPRPAGRFSRLINAKKHSRQAAVHLAIAVQPFSLPMLARCSHLQCLILAGRRRPRWLPCCTSRRPQPLPLPIRQFVTGRAECQLAGEQHVEGNYEEHDREGEGEGVCPRGGLEGRRAQLPRKHNLRIGRCHDRCRGRLYKTTVMAIDSGNLVDTWEHCLEQVRD